MPRGRKPFTFEQHVAAFWALVAGGEPDECWEWIGKRSDYGYGVLKRQGRNLHAHRVSYEIAVGPIGDGLVIDHLCRNRICVNPRHLEPVTNGENVRRGEPLNRTHCPHGHEYTPENTAYNLTPRGYKTRQCRACGRIRGARWRAARSAARRSS